MTGPELLAFGAGQVPVYCDPYLPEFTARHPSVQRWWAPVLRHLGEPEGGDRVAYVTGGAVHVHPRTFDKIRDAHLTGKGTVQIG